MAEKVPRDLCRKGVTQEEKKTLIKKVVLSFDFNFLRQRRRRRRRRRRRGWPVLIKGRHECNFL